MARPFEIKNTMDNYVYFYSIILANNKDNCLEWNEFLDALDDNPNILVELTKILTESQKIEDLLNPDSEEGNGKKKD